MGGWFTYLVLEEHALEHGAGGDHAGGGAGGEAEEVELGAVRSGWLDELFFFLCMGGSKGRAAVGL